MISERKSAASRVNGRKSRGPRTAAGRVKASRNALRHGLAAIAYRNPAFSGEIERIARLMCGNDRDPLLLQHAIAVAESELVLRCVRAERVAMIERLRDPTAIALARRDDSLQVAKARSDEGLVAIDELMKMRALYGFTEDGIPTRPIEELESLPAQAGWRPPAAVERDEFDAMREAMPDLVRLARYERRAWSRRKRAITHFMKTRAYFGCVESGDFPQIANAGI